MMIEDIQQDVSNNYSLSCYSGLGGSRLQLKFRLLLVVSKVAFSPECWCIVDTVDLRKGLQKSRDAYEVIVPTEV